MICQVKLRLIDEEADINWSLTPKYDRRFPHLSCGDNFIVCQQQGSRLEGEAERRTLSPIQEPQKFARLCAYPVNSHPDLVFSYKFRLITMLTVD